MNQETIKDGMVELLGSQGQNHQS